MTLCLARFAAKVAERQLRLGGQIAIENLRNSLAWDLPSMVASARRPAVRKVHVDTGAFGLKHRKPMRIYFFPRLVSTMLV